MVYAQDTHSWVENYSYTISFLAFIWFKAKEAIIVYEYEKLMVTYVIETLYLNVGCDMLDYVHGNWFP